MRHGKMGRHGDTVGHGHGNLLVLLVACRGLGAHHLSVLLKLESLRALVDRLWIYLRGVGQHVRDRGATPLFGDAGGEPYTHHFLHSR